MKPGKLYQSKFEIAFSTQIENYKIIKIPEGSIVLFLNTTVIIGRSPVYHNILFGNKILIRSRPVNCNLFDSWFKEIT